MKLSNAYIIDGDVIEKRIKELYGIAKRTHFDSLQKSCEDEIGILDAYNIAFGSIYGSNGFASVGGSPKGFSRVKEVL